ncbi:unnamed protein product [Prunus brigantina]
MFKSGNGESWWAKTPRCHHICLPFPLHMDNMLFSETSNDLFPLRSSEILYKWEVELDCNSQLNSLINGSNCHCQDILPLQKLGVSDGLCSLYLR